MFFNIYTQYLYKLRILVFQKTYALFNFHFPSTMVGDTNTKTYSHTHISPLDISCLEQELRRSIWHITPPPSTKSWIRNWGLLWFQSTLCDSRALFVIPEYSLWFQSTLCDSRVLCEPRVRCGESGKLLSGRVFPHNLSELSTSTKVASSMFICGESAQTLAYRRSATTLLWSII